MMTAIIIGATHSPESVFEPRRLELRNHLTPTSIQSWTGQVGEFTFQAYYRQKSNSWGAFFTAPCHRMALTPAGLCSHCGQMPTVMPSQSLSETDLLVALSDHMEAQGFTFNQASIWAARTLISLRSNL